MRFVAQGNGAAPAVLRRLQFLDSPDVDDRVAHNALNDSIRIEVHANFDRIVGCEKPPSDYKLLKCCDLRQRLTLARLVFKKPNLERLHPAIGVQAAPNGPAIFPANSPSAHHGLIQTANPAEG